MNGPKHWVARLKADRPRLKLLIVTAVLANWLAEPVLCRPLGIYGLGVLGVWALNWALNFYAWRASVAWYDYYKTKEARR